MPTSPRIHNVASSRAAGFTLVYVIIGMIVLATLSVGVYTVTSRSGLDMAKRAPHDQVILLAQSGLNYAAAVAKVVKDDETIDDENKAATFKADLEAETYPIAMGPGGFTLSASDVIEVTDENTERVVVTSTATTGDVSFSLSTDFEYSFSSAEPPSEPGSSPADYVLYTGGTLSLPSGSKIDGSVASEKVEVNAANTEITGNIVSRTSVEVSSGSSIGGNICAANGDVILRSANTRVEGDVNAHGNVIVGTRVQTGGNIIASGDVTLQSSQASVAKDVHSGGNVDIGSQCSVHGNVFANGNVSLRNSWSSIEMNVHVGGNLALQNNTHIRGDAYVGGNISIGSPGSIDNNIDGTAHQNTTVPPREEPIPPYACPDVQKPRLQSFTGGTQNVTVPQSTHDTIIPPGKYNILTINGGSTTTLRAGTCNEVTDSGCFFFNAINGANWGQQLRLDLSPGERITVFVTGDVSYTGDVLVSADGATWTPIDELNQEIARELAKKVYWEVHGSFTIGTSNNKRKWFGTVLSKNNISFPSGFFGIGAYATVDGNITIQAANPEINYVVADFARDHW